MTQVVLLGLWKFESDWFLTQEGGALLQEQYRPAIARVHKPSKNLPTLLHNECSTDAALNTLERVSLRVVKPDR